jgi:hypothetical protein
MSDHVKAMQLAVTILTAKFYDEDEVAQEMIVRLCAHESVKIVSGVMAALAGLGADLAKGDSAAERLAAIGLELSGMES